MAIGTGGTLVVAWSGNGVGDSAGVFMQVYNTLTNQGGGTGDNLSPHGDGGRRPPTVHRHRPARGHGSDRGFDAVRPHHVAHHAARTAGERSM
jgi:hypothetical protein